MDQFKKDARAVADGVAAADLGLSIGADAGWRRCWGGEGGAVGGIPSDKNFKLGVVWYFSPFSHGRRNSLTTNNTEQRE